MLILYFLERSPANVSENYLIIVTTVSGEEKIFLQEFFL